MWTMNLVQVLVNYSISLKVCMRSICPHLSISLSLTPQPMKYFFPKIDKIVNKGQCARNIHGNAHKDNVWSLPHAPGPTWTRTLSRPSTTVCPSQAAVWWRDWRSQPRSAGGWSFSSSRQLENILLKSGKNILTHLKDLVVKSALSSQWKYNWCWNCFKTFPKLSEVLTSDCLLKPKSQTKARAVLVFGRVPLRPLTILTFAVSQLPVFRTFA